MISTEKSAGAAGGANLALGPLIATYGKSRSFLFVGWFLAALFSGVGLFVLWLTTQFGPNFKFTGHVTFLYVVGYGSLGLGVAIALLFWRLAASQPTFDLFENGVRASGRAGGNTILYRDLEDLYSLFYGGIGYRAAPGAPWTFIGSRIHRSGELSERLSSLQIEHRGEVLHQQLRAGQPVVFRYFEDSVAQSKSMVASRNMDFPTFDLILSADRLQIGEKSIDIARIAGIKTNLWTEKSSIMDVDGKVFHKIHPSSILSFALLHALIGRQQQAMR